VYVLLEKSLAMKSAVSSGRMTGKLESIEDVVFIIDIAIVVS
jgi:hypothetical protein